MTDNTYIGDHEYQIGTHTVLVKSRVYKNVDKQKKVLGYEISQRYYLHGSLLNEFSMSGDPEWMDLSQDDMDRALSRKAKKAVGIAE